MGTLHFAASWAFPAWMLAALAVVPTVLAVRLAAQLDRAPAMIAMQVGLAAWLVLTSIEQLVPGAAHWPAQCLALAVPALFWVGARQWCAHPRPWMVPSLVAVATALLQIKALEQPSTDVISSAWTAEKIGWLLACSTAWAGTGALDAQGLARTRPRRISLWIAAASPAILAALGGSLVTHPAPYLPLVGVLAWLVRASGVGLTGMHRLAEPMIAVDDKGSVIDANAAAFALLAVPGGNLRRFQAHVIGVPGLRSLLQDHTRECAELFTGTNAATRRCHEARVIGSPGDESGRRVIAIQDVTSRRQSEQELFHQARFDSLTGLANRRFFIARLHDELAAAGASRSSLAVMYIDLDRFKAINDSYGHAAGDELLRTVAHRLRQRLRSSDVVSTGTEETWLARLGGDEFALLLPRIDSIDDATRVATRLLGVLGEPMMLEGSKVWNAASIGIALFPEHAHDVDSLLRSADAALYAAKTKRRGKYQVFEPALTERARRQATIDRLLRAALASNTLEIHYQPKYSLRDRSLGGAEALLRWHDAELGTVAPKEFVPVAEETGLIGQLGEWVLERVCSDLARWRSEGIPIVPISFNVSNKQFAEADMGRLIIERLKRHSLDPHWLEMELTESSILDNDERTAACLRAIREVGMRISLDDFGTGYSSLSCLNRVPLDLLKMDRGLVRDVHTDPGARGVASAVVSMAHSLALEVVAEGVDCEEQAEVLFEMGCDWVQGFVFAAAMAERRFAALLAGTAQAVRTGEARRPGLSSDTQQEPEHRSDEACALIVDDGSGRLGVHAMRMNRIGVAALYAGLPDEGLLFAAESNASIRTLMTSAGVEVATVTRLLDRIETASGRAPALLFVVEDQLPKALLELHRRCRIWTLREPVTDAELRDVARSTLHGTPAGAVQRQHPRAACDSIATVTIGNDTQSALLTSLSMEGAFIELVRRPPEGTSLAITFALAEAEIRTRATVTYQRVDSADHGPAGIGVVFEGLSAEHLDAIRTTVEQRSVRCLA